uniref:Uncharacterized protein n=1 Tax=Pristionchus pacificus TaxID=54126 RepID=A0A2A6CN71_PRIPA|eukprot:PDM79559.1 hypothetical protein PRIPAC_32138 [Pristionchus pacificus]
MRKSREERKRCPANSVDDDEEEGEEKLQRMYMDYSISPRMLPKEIDDYHCNRSEKDKVGNED